VRRNIVTAQAWQSRKGLILLSIRVDGAVTVLTRITGIHGERDERVSRSAVFDWAHRESHPVVVVPGAVAAF
jgi:hypothetical protein